MNITILTTIFPRHKDDYRGSFIGFLTRALAQFNQNTKITVVAPSGKSGLLKESWGRLSIIRFQYWIPQKRQIIAYSGKNSFSNLIESFWKFIQLPTYFFMFLYHTTSLWNKTSIFHCQWTLTAIFPIIINKILFFKTNKPIIITCRGSDLLRLPGWLNRFLIKNVSAVSYPSPLFTINRYKKNFGADIQKYIEKNTSHGGYCIFDPLDELRFKPDKFDLKSKLGLNNKKVILWLANFTSIKNPIYALKIAQNLKKIRSDFCMLFVGFGSGEEKIKDFISENNLKDVVHFIGAVTDVHNYYNISDIFLATNIYDNVWSSTIAESMYIGCPVVLTDIGNTSKIFKNGFDTVFIPLNNGKKSA